MSVTLASDVCSHLYIIAQTFATKWRVETVMLLPRARGAGRGACVRAERPGVARRLAWRGDWRAALGQRVRDSVTQPTDDAAGRILARGSLRTNRCPLSLPLFCDDAVALSVAAPPT